MAYTAVLSATLNGTPTLGNIRIAVDGQTISSGITATTNSNGSGFEATVATLSDGFRGPFTFYDSTDATNFATGSVGPEDELLDAAVSTRSTFDASSDDVTTDAASRTASQADVSALATQASVDALPDAAAINAEVDTALADYDPPTKAELDAAVSGLSTFDHTSDTVTTDAASRTASQATGFSTHSASDVRTEIDSNSTQLAAIVADTNELQTDDIPGLIAALNNLSTADIDARLAAYDAPTKAEMDSAFATTDGLITTVDGIVDAILVDTDVTIPALITALNNLSEAQVNAQVDAALADYDGPTKTELDAAQAAIQSDISGLNDLSASDVDARIAAAEPLDANVAQVAGAGVTGVNDFKADVSGITVDNAAIADAVWDEATADHVAAGSFGLLISTVATASAVAQAVWQYATRTLTSSAAQTNNAVSSTTLTVTRGVTFSHTFTGSIPDTWDRVLFTAKSSDCLGDSAAIVQVLATNPAAGSDGLQRLEGEAATANQASITVDDANDTAQLTIHDAATAALLLRAATDGAEYDCKLILGDSTSSLLASGTFSVESTPTWTT